MKFLTAFLSILLLALGQFGCDENDAPLRMGFEEDNSAPEALTGQVLLENMTDHSGIRVELVEIGVSLITDQDGKFSLPKEIADGEWTIRASYPYFSTVEEKFSVVGGVPESGLEPMTLTQEVVFDVLPDKPIYTFGETVNISLNVHNIVDHAITLSSASSPMTAFAVRLNDETIFGGLYPGKGAEPQSITLEAGQMEDFSITWTIDNPELPAGAEYQIYALLTVSADYPDYFATESSTLSAELNDSLYSKLVPTTIIIQ